MSDYESILCVYQEDTPCKYCGAGRTEYTVCETFDSKIIYFKRWCGCMSDDEEDDTINDLDLNSDVGRILRDKLCLRK